MSETTGVVEESNMEEFRVEMKRHHDALRAYDVVARSRHKAIMDVVKDKSASDESVQVAVSGALRVRMELEECAKSMRDIQERMRMLRTEMSDKQKDLESSVVKYLPEEMKTVPDRPKLDSDLMRRMRRVGRR